MWSNIITIIFMSGCPYISESVVYLLQRTTKSFQGSLGYCTSRFDGLAEVYNAEQQQYLSLIADGKEAWIGVEKCQQNWCYAGSNRMVSYTNWAKGEPNNYYSFFKGEENCVLMLSSQKWNDENCPYQYYFVCQQLQCKATTCNRRGTCTELVNGFSCICGQGFYGNNCEKVTSCPVITKPNHSTVNCEGSHGKNHFQSVCTFTCDRGFILNGINSATCQASGSWTTYNTICQAITCTFLKKPEHSNVNCSGPYGGKHYNTSCYFSCDDGYTLERDHKTVCKESGNWSTHDVQCTVNHLKLITIIVTMGAVALLVLSVICCWKRRNRQEQSNTGNDLPMQQKMSAYESRSIYVLPTPCLNNETPEDEIYVNNIGTHQDIYENMK